MHFEDLDQFLVVSLHKIYLRSCTFIFTIIYQFKYWLLMNYSAFLQYTIFIKLFDTLNSIQLKRMDMMSDSIRVYESSNHKISQSTCNQSIKYVQLKLCKPNGSMRSWHHVCSLSKLNGEYKVRSSTEVVCTFWF